MKKNYPSSKITLLTRKNNKDVVKYDSNIDKTVFIDKIVLSIPTILKLRSTAYDKIFELNDDPSTTSSVILKYLKGKTKIGYAFNNNIKYLTTAVDRPEKIKSHIIERTLLLLEASGASVRKDDIRSVLHLGEKEKMEVLEHVKSERNSSLLISVNLSAGAPVRYWKETYWIRLTQLIFNHSPFVKILFLAHPKDVALRDRILAEFEPNSFILPKYFNFQHFAAYIYASDLLITPDTSAVHIASAFQKPVIGLYPNYEWSFVSWQPYKTPHRSIKSCTESISEIQPTEVFNAYLELADEIKLFKK